MALDRGNCERRNIPTININESICLLVHEIDGICPTQTASDGVAVR